MKVYTLNYSFVNEGRTLLYLKGCGDATPTKLEDVNQINVPSLKKNGKYIHLIKVMKKSLQVD